MKVQYCSDLHLEFDDNSHFIKKTPIVPVGEILILAGDIVLFAHMDRFNWFFDWVSDQFERVYWIPGNHEYYYSDINERSGFVNEQIRRNVFLVNNITVSEGDTRFLFSTLWSKISEVNRFRIQQSISDFRVIKDGEHLLSTDRFNELHQASLDFLKDELSSSKQQTVVVSHHVPTYMCYPEKYKGDIINEAFVVELEDLIRSNGISHWIFGHHHQNVGDFEIGNTKLLTNQLGYVKYNENENFELDKYFIID